jgi:hypothetical protein
MTMAATNGELDEDNESKCDGVGGALPLINFSLLIARAFSRGDFNTGLRSLSTDEGKSAGTSKSPFGKARITLKLEYIGGDDRARREGGRG